MVFSLKKVEQSEHADKYQEYGADFHHGLARIPPAHDQPVKEALPQKTPLTLPFCWLLTQ